MTMEGDAPPPITYDLELLGKSRDKWQQSEGLRVVYKAIFQSIKDRMIEGPSLELGSGIGNLKESLPGVVTSDLVKTEFVDRACSAYKILPPDADETGTGWANIMAVDMLHHLCRPMDFFRSAARALEADGRIILVEPAATAFGRLFYSLFHPEPIKPFRIMPPFEMKPDNEEGEFANMGMGVSLFRLNQEACSKLLEEMGLEVVEVSYRDFLAYPLSGGYSGPQLAPAWLLRPFLGVERMLPQWLMRMAALRMTIVIRRLPDSLPASSR